MMLVKFIAVMVVVAFQMPVRALAKMMGEGNPALDPLAEACVLGPGRGELL
jgi:hypothetical protein